MISFGLAQTTVHGVIKDSLSGEPIPFASIGISGKPLGTLSTDIGKFEFTFDDRLSKDSIKVAAIGYKQLTFSVKEFSGIRNGTIYLKATPMELEEVTVKAKKIKYDILGSKNFTKNNCSGFVKNSANWKGSEAAILAGNKEGRLVRLESFGFYVIQNKYADSLMFRLMFYEASPKKYPRLKTILKKPVIFKLGIKQGEFVLDLKDYNIITSKDFFISLECLMDEMDISKFCYAGSYSTPSFVKSSAFDRWYKIRGGGGDFNVKVSYTR